MVKFLRNRLLIACCGLFIALVAGTCWLLGTVTGNTWLLTTLARDSSVTLRVTIEEPLWSGLRARGLEFSWPGGEFSATTLEVDWEPWQLLTGNLLVERLSLDTPHVTWGDMPKQQEPSSPPSPFALNWPKTPAWLGMLQIEVREIEITAARLTPPEPPPLEIERLNASLTWQQQELQVNHQLRFNPDDTCSGNWRLNLVNKALAADLTLSWEGIYLELSTKLDGSGQASRGPLLLTYREDQGYGARLAANLTLRESRLDFSEIDLKRLTGPDQVRGSASLDWRQGSPLGMFDLTFSSLDLAPETGWATRLDGMLRATVAASGYHGEIQLENRGDAWEEFQMKGHLAGDWNQVMVTPLEGRWLRGRLTGEVDVSWEQNLQLEAQLSGEHLDPQAFNRQLHGDVNLDLQGSLSVAEDNLVAASWQASFPASTLRGHPFRGGCRGSWMNDDLTLEECRIEDQGALLDVRGTLSERLDLEFSADELSDYTPDAGGTLGGTGWLGYREGQLQGALALRGHELAYRDLKLQQLEFTLDHPASPAARAMKLTAANLTIADTLLSHLELAASGDPQQHTLDLQANWPEGEVSAAASGSWQAPAWTGQLLELVGSTRQLGSWALQRPSGVLLAEKHFELEGLELAGEYGETLSLAFKHHNNAFDTAATWDSLPLVHLNPWIKGPELDGETSGSLQFSLLADRSLALSLHLTALPTLAWNGTTVEFQTCRLDADWGSEGLDAHGMLQLSGQGMLELEAYSPRPGHLSFPDDGNLRLNWSELPLRHFVSLLPDGATLAGVLNGELTATLHPAARFSLRGSSSTGDVRIRLEDDTDLPPLELEQLTAEIDWSDSNLRAGVALEVAGYGTADARGSFPLPAAWPLKWQQQQPWSGFANLDFPRLQPFGMLWPDIVTQTSGSLHAEAALAGTPRSPDYRGAIDLREATAEIVPANIRLQDISLQAGLAGDQLQITSLQASSGGGTLQGSGSLVLGFASERPALDLALHGKDFRMADLPAISFTISPELRLHGDPRDLLLEGKIDIPQLLINEPTISTAVTPSDDIVLTEELAREKRAYEKLRTRLNVHLTLGDRVLMKVKGLDARLSGDLQLGTGKGNTLTGRGEIRVADGRYAAYGIALPITRGRLLFGGGPIEEPNLDVLAERTVDQVRAGVEVTGTPRKPRIRLTSDPAMADTDILSYIVLGKPLSEDRDQGQSDAMMLAAGALLSRGESAVLRDKLGNQLGLDEVTIRNDGGVENTVITVGKYLTPDLYLSYGRGISNDSGTAQLRYRINEQWQMESELGNVSGADLYYRIELP